MCEVIKSFIDKNTQVMYNIGGTYKSTDKREKELVDKGFCKAKKTNAKK